jgi:hypothetical protein
MSVKTVDALFTMLRQFILMLSKMSVVDVMLYTFNTPQQEKETNDRRNLPKD